MISKIEEKRRIDFLKAQEGARTLGELWDRYIELADTEEEKRRRKLEEELALDLG